MYYIGDYMENKNNELKPTSFRITEETSEKFKIISKEIGGNQQLALTKLIEAYELQQAKNVLTEKKDDIEQFERYISCLTRMYMTNLEDYKNVKELIRTEFDNELKSKDKIIQDLQEKLELLQQTEKKAKETSNTAEKLLKQATEEIQQQKKESEKQRDSYEKQIQALSESKNSLTDLCENLNQQLNETKNIKSRLYETEELKAEISRLTAQIKEREYAHKQELLEYREQMQNEQMSHFREITELQKEYRNLLLSQQQKPIVIQEKPEISVPASVSTSVDLTLLDAD